MVDDVAVGDDRVEEEDDGGDAEAALPLLAPSEGEEDWGGEDEVLLSMSEDDSRSKTEVDSAEILDTDDEADADEAWKGTEVDEAGVALDAIEVDGSDETEDEAGWVNDDDADDVLVLLETDAAEVDG